MSEQKNENVLQEKARGAASVVKEAGGNQPVATTGGKDTGERRVVLANRNNRGVSFPDGDGGLIRYAAGVVHTVPAELADAKDPQGRPYFEDVKEEESE